MERRKSIFDFASKELSTTALWAWVLSSEQSDEIELKSLNTDLRLKLNVPIGATLESIELEKNPDDPGLQVVSPSDLDVTNNRKRIDILVTYRMSDESMLRIVIENKVRRDLNAIEQVLDYRDRLKRRVIGDVRAAVFTFDDALAKSERAVQESVIVLALSEMVALINRHASSNAILAAYYEFLRDKQTVAKASPLRGSHDSYPENLDRWSVVAGQKGIRALLEEYVGSAEKYGFTVKHSKNRSIFLTHSNRSPLVSVHPLKSSAVSGLWLGVSVTNLSRSHGVIWGRPEMPVDFAWKIEEQSGNEWRFGYVRAQQIDSTLRAVAQTVTAH
ncbi:MAG: PD-(D/E)XK nuclease family protein [Mycolicibacterium cosmeticum]|nr:PD-(D/E)XK nuclease family protein [Mycolicibacterium cosmeticum]